MCVRWQMRECYHWLQFGQVNGNCLSIYCINIWSDWFNRTIYAAFDVFFSNCIVWEYATFTARFNSHVTDGKAVSHSHVLHAFTSKFKSHVTSAIYADLTNQIKNYVFTSYPFVRFTDKLNLDCFRHFEPSFTFCHSNARISGAYACGECIHRTICTSVGVSADHHFARTDKTFFWQNNVLDTHSTHFKVVRNAMFAYEIAHYFCLCSGLNIFIWCKVVRHQVDFMTIKYRFADF